MTFAFDNPEKKKKKHSIATSMQFADFDENYFSFFQIVSELCRLFGAENVCAQVRVGVSEWITQMRGGVDPSTQTMWISV